MKNLVTAIEYLEKIRNLESLPDEMILTILSHLDAPEDLLILSQVSKHFENICKDVRLWQHFGFESKERYIEIHKEMLGTQKEIEAKLGAKKVKNIVLLGISLDNNNNKKLFHNSTGMGKVLDVDNHQYMIADFPSKPQFFSASKHMLEGADIIFIFPQNADDAKNILEKKLNQLSFQPSVIVFLAEPNKIADIKQAVDIKKSETLKCNLDKKSISCVLPFRTTTFGNIKKMTDNPEEIIRNVEQAVFPKKSKHLSQQMKKK